MEKRGFLDFILGFKMARSLWLGPFKKKTKKLSLILFGAGTGLKNNQRGGGGVAYLVLKEKKVFSR